MYVCMYVCIVCDGLMAVRGWQGNNLSCSSLIAIALSRMDPVRPRPATHVPLLLPQFSRRRRPQGGYTRMFGRRRRPQGPLGADLPPAPRLVPVFFFFLGKK